MNDARVARFELVVLCSEALCITRAAHTFWHPHHKRKLALCELCARKLARRCREAGVDVDAVAITPPLDPPEPTL